MLFAVAAEVIEGEAGADSECESVRNITRARLHGLVLTRINDFDASGQSLETLFPSLLGAGDAETSKARSGVNSALTRLCFEHESDEVTVQAAERAERTQRTEQTEIDKECDQDASNPREKQVSPAEGRLPGEIGADKQQGRRGVLVQ